MRLPFLFSVSFRGNALWLSKRKLCLSSRVTTETITEQKHTSQVTTLYVNNINYNFPIFLHYLFQPRGLSTTFTLSSLNWNFAIKKRFKSLILFKTPWPMRSCFVLGGVSMTNTLVRAIHYISQKPQLCFFFCRGTVSYHL